MGKHDFSEFFDEGVVNEQQTRTIVPNVFPIITNTDYRIAICGEAPGSDEVALGTPFVGASGRELDKYLSKVGILRDACYIGNVCRHQPAGNKIANFEWLGLEIQGGLSVLSADLNLFKPNLCWLLGASALHAFKEGVHQVPKKRNLKKEGPIFDFPNKIGDWRGSLFLSSNDSPYPNCKCIASYHPAAAMRTYEWMPLILLDLLFKVWPQSKSPELTLPKRKLLVNLNFDETLSELRKIQQEKPLISLDIEGGVGTMSCLSVAPLPSYAFIVPFTTLTGKSLWSLNEEQVLFRELVAVLGNPSIPKVLQNSLYDRFVLQYSYGIIVRGVVDDTMLKHWELYCELEKSLGFQCSLYTDQPFYKSDRHADDKETFWRYCCMDSATTLEISQKLSKWLHGGALDHYKFNVALLNPLLYMELRGIRYDSRLAKTRKTRIDTKIYELQHTLDTLSGFGTHGSDKVVLRGLLRDTMCYKRDSSKVKADYVHCFDELMRVLLGEGDLTPTHLGRISTELKLHLNTKGPEFKTYLYETLKLPTQYDPKSKAPTTDYLALITLTKKATTELQQKVLEVAISIGELRTRSQMLGIHADKDGRVRAGYNIVGTETSRITCYTSPTGSGYNLQTIPEDNTLRREGDFLREGMRDLFIADEGHYLFKCDLSGADGWTIGAHLYSLGKPMMLDDLRAKIKPAQRICYMLRHGTDSLRGKPREEVKELLKEVKKDDWDYFSCKQGIWGICYLMGPDKLAEVILQGSEGKIALSRDDVRTFRNAVFACYEPNIWHDAVGRKLKTQPYPPSLTSASGHTRKFFGRPTEILGQALANEPQENTTYAVKKALYRLWNDQENRILPIMSPQLGGPPSRNSESPLSSVGRTSSERASCLRVEPLHTVHDSLDGQFAISDTFWAISKIKQWFDNPLIIAGQKITIPFSGAYGTNWSMDDKAKVGDI